MQGWEALLSFLLCGPGCLLGPWGLHRDNKVPGGGPEVAGAQWQPGGRGCGVRIRMMFWSNVLSHHGRELGTKGGRESLEEAEQLR